MSKIMGVMLCLFVFSGCYQFKEELVGCGDTIPCCRSDGNVWGTSTCYLRGEEFVCGLHDDIPQCEDSRCPYTDKWKLQHINAGPCR